MATGLLLVLIGAVGAVMGLWGLLDERAARFYRQARVGQKLSVGLGPGAPAMYLLNGGGLGLVGVALFVGKNALTIGLTAVGCVAMVAGVALYIAHPGWAQPAWMRRRAE